MVGRTLGRYRIVEEIGAGGMGVVYRAHDERLDRYVALKIIAAGTLGDEAARKRFRKEALALSKLNHPNVATVFDFDSEDGVDFLVMELVEGQSIADRLATGPIPEPEALRLGGQLLDGLAAAHSANIVHRDLKPGNLRVTPEGRLKILDFGLAKVLRPALATAATMSDTDHAAIGTLPYMPPEQLSGGVVDARADIYAAGAVLYEMAAGQRAFPDPSGPRLVDAILHQMPVAPTAVNGSISPAFAGVILKALDKDPDRRYQSARELLVDIDRLRNPGSVAAAPAPRREFRLRLPSRRWVTAGAAATVAGTALIIWLMGSDAALSFAPRDWILVADFDNQTGNALFDRSLTTAFTVGLEQSTHANVVPRQRIASALKRMGKTNVERIDEPLAREIAIRENVRLLVASGISRPGNQYALTSRLVNPQTGETVRSYMETASDDTLLTALGKVAASIRKDLGESLAALDASNRPLPQVTTPSLEALQHYADGFHLWGQGHHDQAVQRYESAIKLDPDFAMAHAKLGICYYSYVYNDPVRGRQHSEKALALADRTTERERLLINATYKGNVGYAREATAAYDLYLKSYPDDYTQRYNYGNELRDNRQYEEAIKQYSEVLRAVPDHASSHINLAVSLVALDRSAEALEHYDRAFVLEPDWITSGVLNHEYGFTLIKAGNEQKARQVFDKALAKPATKAAGLRSIALLELTHGRYAEAKTRLTEAILDHAAANRTLSKARDHAHLAIVLDGMGDARGNQRELDLAAALMAKMPEQLWMGATIGARLARAGAAGKAAGLEKAMASHVDQKSDNDRSSLHRLQAEIALAQGNRPKSIELFQLAHRESDSSLTLEGLAFASAQAGQVDEAIARYEALIRARDRSMGWEPQQSWYDAHYRLASLYAGRGNAARARELLTALLTYWKDADPDLPLVLRARRLQEQISR